MTTMTINIITIVAEVSLVLIFFFLVDWSFSKLYRQIFKIPILEKRKSSASAIRRNVRGFLFLISFLVSLGIVGINSFLIYRGENIRDYSLELIRKIPTEFWISLGLGVVKSIGAIIVTSIALRIFNNGLDSVSKYAQKFDGIADNDDSVADFFNAFKKNINSASWIAIAILCAQFLILPAVVTKYLYILLRIYIIIAIGLLIFKIVAVIIDSLDGLSVKYSNPDNILRFYEQLRHLVSFLKRCLEYIIYIIMATLVIQQIDFVAGLSNWGPVGIKLIAIVLLSRILISVIYLSVEELLLNSQDLTPTQQQRRETITPLVQSISKYFVYFGSGVFMLDTIGVDPAPILAGAGILGLAVGFGAQNLVNDIVSGFFILFENYYLVGDYIETEEASGYVEAIELRTTRLRHHHGQVHILRNGDITSITNYSKEFVYAAVDIGVDYNTNLDRLYEIIEAIGYQLQEENEDVLEPTHFEGIEEFGDIRIVIHTKTKVKPGQHLQIQRILRKRYKEEFDREGIYIPVSEMADKPDWAVKLEKEERNQIARNAKQERPKIVKPQPPKSNQPPQSNQLMNTDTQVQTPKETTKKKRRFWQF
ncbi:MULTISPECIES: mechanosensitive ion channel family protein [Spirulina sp. CCY15215]|uniref:mechanosensitive ion channel family protein n=1 Tax=Spirulina sp. CCY15215 TaxID=2767591 RepID=UPI00194F8B73|nr:mechanosensitive ion channel family protein [Spirulina major]